MSDRHYLEKELQALLRNDPQIFEFLQSGSLDGIWYWDLVDQNAEWMSARFWETFGYDPASKQHLVSEWQEMVHPEDLERALENFQKHAEDPNHPYDQIVRYKHRDGSTVWVRCRGLIIRDAAGNPSRMLGAHTNVTELKKVEEELRQANEALRRSNEELEELTYIASHDLQEPLRVVASFTELLSERCENELDETATKYMNYIVDGTHRMQGLVRDILQLSRVSRRREAWQDVDLTAACECGLGRLEEVVKESGVAVALTSLPIVKGDRSQLETLFENLLSNAIKYSHPGDVKIEVSGETDPDGTVTVHVKDNGIGFEQHYSDRIFRIFQRLHGRSEYSGSGIGLAIVKKVVEHHGGDVWCKSAPGEGSTFSFSIRET